MKYNGSQYSFPIVLNRNNVYANNVYSSSAIFPSTEGIDCTVLGAGGEYLAIEGNYNGTYFSASYSN